MAVKVADASAVAALLFGEPESAAVASRLAQSRLVAPALLFFEIANVCLKKALRHPRQRDALFAAFRLLPRMSIEPVDGDHLEVLELADQK